MENHFRYVGFSSSFDSSDYTMVSGPPIGIHQNQANFLNSVSPQFWLILGLTWVFLSVGYFFVIKIEGEIIKPNPFTESLVECMLTFYGLLFQRGFENLPENVSSRLMVVGWLLLVIVVMTDLASCLTSQMAIADVPVRLDKTTDVLQHPEMHFYTTKGLYADVYMRTSKDPEILSVFNKHVMAYDGLQDYTVFFDSPWIMDEISSGKAVAMENADCTLLFWINEDCRKFKRPYHIAKEALFNRNWALLYRRGLEPEIVEFLNRIALNFGSQGFHQLLRKRSGKDSGPCLNQKFDQNIYKPMVVRDIVATLTILWVGLGVSSAICLIECLYARGIKSNSLKKWKWVAVKHLKNLQ